MGISNLLHLMEVGGGFMWLILLSLLFGIAVIFERFYAVLYRYNINGSDLVTKVKKSILANKINRAIAVCDNKPSAALCKVFKAGLVNSDRSLEDIQKSVDDSALEMIQNLVTRTPYLATIANISTLLGLLGTIFGLIDSFESVGAASAEERQTLLAAGISVAMYTTAFGLISAIPCLVSFAIIQNKTTGIVDEIDRYSSKLIDMLKTFKETPQSSFQNRADQGETDEDFG